MHNLVSENCHVNVSVVLNNIEMLLYMQILCILLFVFNLLHSALCLLTVAVFVYILSEI